MRGRWWMTAGAVAVSSFACSSDPDTLAGNGAATGDPSSTADDGTGTGGNDGSAAPHTGSTGGSDDPAQLCVDTINDYRKTLSLPAYTRWTDGEDCASKQAKADGSSTEAHGAFGECGESAQNECPGWPGPPASMIADCLDLMWKEGPGGGHHDDMANKKYTKVACGFADGKGGVWAVQNFR